MREGMTSAGSFAVGHGAMQRLADSYDIYTADGNGTATYMVFRPAPVPAQAAPWQIGAVSIALPGEEICGDAWVASGRPGCLNALVADGLGHGPSAAEASQTAAGLIASQPDL